MAVLAARQSPVASRSLVSVSVNGHRGQIDLVGKWKNSFILLDMCCQPAVHIVPAPGCGAD